MARKFDPMTDIPDLSGKVALVTGGNSGLGEATVAALAAHKAKVYLGARSRTRALEAISRIKATVPDADIEILEIDLASFDSIKFAAAEFNDRASRLDILQLNGGIAIAPFGLTKEGYEIQSGTNYISHVLLTQLLMPKLLKTAELPGADVRIVLMGSTGHRACRVPKDTGIDWETLKSDGRDLGGFQLYARSMLAKILFAKELAKRYPQFTTASLHPGTVLTSVWGGDKSVNPLLRMVIMPVVRLTGVTSEEGAKTQLWCSVSDKVESGSYYEPIGKAGQGSSHTKDDRLAESLWDWTAKELLDHGGPGWLGAA